MTEGAWASLVGRTIKSFSVIEDEVVFLNLDDGRTVVIEIEGPDAGYNTIKASIIESSMVPGMVSMYVPQA